MAVRFASLTLGFILLGSFVSVEAADTNQRIAQPPQAQTTQLPQLQSKSQATRAATQKLSAAMKAHADAKAKLATARDQASAAESEQAKQATEKLVQQAAARVQATQKAVDKQREESRRIIAQANAMRTAARYGAGIVARQNPDPHDAQERFAILTPGGPLIVQVSLSLDGKPFRQQRDALVSELLKDADMNGDGKLTWEEALSTPRFTLGRIRISNEQQRKSYLQQWDLNKDELVDRQEAHLFVTQISRAPAFSLFGTSGYATYRTILAVNGRARYARAVDAHQVLDVDHDGVLSEQEIAGAGARLKSRDADDNDLLEANEASGAANLANPRGRTATKTPTRLAVLLGPTLQTEALHAALLQRYPNDDGDIEADSFKGFPALFAKLDENADGVLQTDELSGVNKVAPHLELEVQLGKSDAPDRIRVQHVAPQLSEPTVGKHATSMNLPGVNLNFQVNPTSQRTSAAEQTAKQYLSRYDKDGNRYLDKQEVPANFLRQFVIWDGDQDGKVYAKEIIASYRRMLAPQASQVRTLVRSQGNSLFQTMDLSGDGRLSLREMRTAAEQIRTFDADKNGEITQEEIPFSISIQFSQGNSGFSQNPGQPPANANSQNQVNQQTPEWFTRMDRNGDGDLTLKEFLGTKEKFKSLDSNADGFIEPREANATQPEANDK